MALELHASLAPGSYMGTLEVDFTATDSACVAKHYRQLVVTQAIETDDNIQAALTAASYSNGTVMLTFGVDITPGETMDLRQVQCAPANVAWYFLPCSKGEKLLREPFVLSSTAASARRLIASLVASALQLKAWTVLSGPSSK